MPAKIPLPLWRLDEIVEEILPEVMQRCDFTEEQARKVIALARESIEERYVIDRRPRPS